MGSATSPLRPRSTSRSCPASKRASRCGWSTGRGVISGRGKGASFGASPFRIWLCRAEAICVGHALRYLQSLRTSRHGRRARPFPQRRSRRLCPFCPQLRRSRPDAGADRFAASPFGPRRCADPDRSGRRPGGADEAARMARFPRGRGLRRTLRKGADQRDRGGAGQRNGLGPDARRGWRQRRSPCRCSTCASRAPTT